TASLSIDPIRDGAGRITGAINIFDDISDRKRAEEVQRQTEERFRLAAHSEAITLYEQDRDLRYRWLYPIHSEHQEALGKTDVEILGNDEGALLMNWKRQVMTTGSSQRREVRITLRNRTKCYDLFISPRRDRAGEIIGVAG